MGLKNTLGRLFGKNKKEEQYDYEQTIVDMDIGCVYAGPGESSYTVTSSKPYPANHEDYTMTSNWEKYDKTRVAEDDVTRVTSERPRPAAHSKEPVCFCARCAAAVPMSAKFCMNCGSPMKPVTPVKAPPIGEVYAGPPVTGRKR